MNRDVKVHTCRQNTEFKEIEYLETNIRYYTDDPKFKSFKALPERCECKKIVTRSRADILIEQGTAVKVYKPKTGRLLNDNRVDRFQIVMIVNRSQTPRVDLISEPDIERAYVDNREDYKIYIEEVHKMIMEERAKLIAPFQDDPTNGRLLFPFGPDQRT